MDGGRGRTIAATIALTVAITLLGTPGVRADRLPTPKECAAGTAEPLTLGEAKGALALCSEGLYVGGNAVLTCGTVIVADTAVVGTVDDDPAAECQAADPPDDVLRYHVAVPASYETDSSRRFPVLYLLPGGGGNEGSWQRFTDVVPALTERGFIVVLPYGGTTFHTNWELGEHREYERAFIERLIPTIDATYRTIADRAHRAIGGFSRGGYGAMLTTARHPDLFAAAGSFSGALDPLGQLREEQLYVAAATLPGRYDELVGNAPWFGDPVTNELGWRERSPVDLARALSRTDLWVTSADGIPDADDPVDPFTPVSMLPEILVRQASYTFHRELDGLGIDHHYGVHAGIHDYPNAVADIVQWADHVRSTALTQAAPPTFDLRNADPTFGAYGWTFAADANRAAEFLDVTNAGAHGLTLTGSGATTVTTAPLFSPGEMVDVTVDGAPHAAQADQSGRLQLIVDLGPAHRTQQFTLEAVAAAQQPRTAIVRFARS